MQHMAVLNTSRVSQIYVSYSKLESSCNIQKAHAHDAVKCVFAPSVDLQFTEDDDRERGTDEIGYYSPC